MSTDPLLPPDGSNDPARQPVTPPPGSPGSLQTTDSGLTPNVAAGLAVVFTPISGLIFLFLEKRSQFVRLWAMQSVFFGVAWVVFYVASFVIGFVLYHILSLLGYMWGLASWLVNLGFLVVWIIMLIKAFGGKEWEVPVIGKFARQQLGKPPTV